MAIEDSNGKPINLLQDYNKLTTTEVLTHAKKTWGVTSANKLEIPDATAPTATELQVRILSVMIASWVCNSLSETANNTLDLEKEFFQFRYDSSKQIEEDGTMMMKLILDRVNPSTRVGVKNLITKLNEMRLRL